MPSDSNGVFSLVSGYLAVTGTTIQISQHNPVFEDIATALTARLPKNGAAAMTGTLQLADGTQAAPSLVLATNPASGFYQRAGRLGMVDVVGQVPVGAIIDWAGIGSAPACWQLCYGQSLLRTDFVDLFNAIGTTYGAVDGTHFSVPDLRGFVPVGRLDMGGASGGAIDATSYGSNPTTMGATGGVKDTTLAQAHIPAYTLSNTLGISDTRTWQLAETSGLRTFNGVNNDEAFSGGAFQHSFINRTVNVASGSISITGSVTSGGGGTAFSRIQPSKILNKIIFAGA